MGQDIFAKFLERAGSMPGIRIDRDNFLRTTFGRNYKNKLDQIVMQGPIAAGIPLKEISEIADQSIKTEAIAVTAVSAGTGMFGGYAALIAVPADIVQFYGHQFRMIQKLMYLYGWDEDIFDQDGNLDDATTNVLILYMGVMFGVGVAGKALGHIAKVAAKRLIRDIPVHVFKSMVRKQAVRKIVMQIIKIIGVKTSAKLFLITSSKIVPVIGALASGGLSAIFFIPMSKKLKKYLEKGELKNWDEEDNLESLVKESKEF